MTFQEAYKALAKHTYSAHRKYAEKPQFIIIFASDMDKAKEKAQKYFKTSLISVERVNATEDFQIYEV